MKNMSIGKYHMEGPVSASQKETRGFFGKIKDFTSNFSKKIKDGIGKAYDKVMEKVDNVVYAPHIRRQDVVFWAIKNGHKNFAKRLIQRGADVNTKNMNGRSLMHLSIEKKYDDVTNLLIQKGADINAVDMNGYTPIQLAASLKNKDIVNKLLDMKELNVNACQKGTPSLLHTSIMLGDKETFDKLLTRKDINLNVVDAQGRTGVHYAVMYGRKEMLKDLLAQKGLRLNAVDKNGRTPLHEAAKNPRNGYEMTKMLMSRKGIKTNVIDKKGLSPVQGAFVEGYGDIVSLFKEKGYSHLNNKKSVKNTFKMKKFLRENEKKSQPDFKISDVSYVKSKISKTY